ncbi:MBL fold metallo-hydrolase [Massilia soli]|uniref:MBL fold metallo-hydrolase n=1 Tax=Massilia soli TaxID=2792854 RepID=A0ABS7SUS5_9BURK|nr:MBL fold metallo-hydrolase [Massilia soli]MBZ2209709.1 MBL fold metallo-hydrolase [Massilia soli]
MSLRISRILHAGYVFECDGARIAFDPIFENPFSTNCHAFPDVRFDLEQIRRERFDAVFISHFHDDHCSLDSLNLLDRSTPIHIYCIFDELFDMIRALGFPNLYKLETNVPVSIGPFSVTPREAIDSDVDSMYQIRAGGMNVLNVVDSWISPVALADLAKESPWDMVLWPFQTMREIEVLAPSRADASPPEIPAEWLGQLKVLNPRFVVPSSCQFIQESWSWYQSRFFPITYAQFQREVEAALPDAKVIRLNPSVSIVLDRDSLQAADALPWVIPVGEQDVDYRYDSKVAPPHTAELARHFPALMEDEMSVVLDYCRSGLLQKYEEMELPEDSFFDQARIWRLSIYGQDGAQTAFHYRVEGDAIALVDGTAAPAWTTEVPAAKLFAALTQGEALTSMYMRINDALFDADVEADHELAEIVDDPLIRCLFNDAFGAYQAAQLRRLGITPS